MARVLLAWVCPGTVDNNFMVSILETLRAAPSHSIEADYFSYWSGPVLSKARCAIVDHFLQETTAEWLLQSDSDMSFTPSALPLLLEAPIPITVPSWQAWPLAWTPRRAPVPQKRTDAARSMASTFPWPPGRQMRLSRWTP
jgi:hypothetical protein